ncbi:MAG: ankyrin repeat domain-containing protein, partial [Candidatus Methylumidiphilus sp.]
SFPRREKRIIHQFKQKADDLVSGADWPGLLEHSQKWTGLDRLNPEAWLAFGLANYELAQFSLAQPAFETYFRLKQEDNDEVLGYLTKTYIKLKKKGAAERALVRVIALRSKFNRPRSSEDAYYYNELGNIYFSSPEKRQEALQLYRQALAMEPNNESFKSNVNAALKALANQPMTTGAQQSSQETYSANANGNLNNLTAWQNESHPPDTKQKTNPGLSAAAAAGDFQAVQLLLNKGADINLLEMGSFPLIQAAKHKQSEMVAWLLKLGADVNAEDSNGNKAIIYSIVNGDKKSMDFLTNAGALQGYR